MRELVELMARALVDDPEGVEVREITGDRETVVKLSVAPADLGKVIGRQGRTANSIRTILAAAGNRVRKRVVLEIVD
ncbi:MAG TPA: KH domain-containing protein [Candidatus Polarisedimenticolaceae bacterium]|nr:KH domain-containing protein [Candidatus Polarisedimenticolaceae bacterium]